MLYKLQDIERKIAAAQQRIREIDDTLANDAKIRAAQDAAQAAKAPLPALHKQVRELEHELETTTAKSSETEERLYSGAVKNPKEMQEMQQEITTLKTKQTQLEENMLGVLEQIEAAEDNVQQQEAALEKVVQGQRHQHEALLLEKEKQESELHTLNTQHGGTVESLSEQSIKLYNQLKPRTRGIVVAKMNNDATCGVCGVQQDRATENDVRRGILTQCTNCRRVLAWM